MLYRAGVRDDGHRGQGRLVNGSTELEAKALVDAEWAGAGDVDAGTGVGDEDPFLRGRRRLLPGDYRVVCRTGFGDEEVVGFPEEGLSGSAGVKPRGGPSSKP